MEKVAKNGGKEIFKLLLFAIFLHIPSNAH
jgi:hypothetical protein